MLGIVESMMLGAGKHPVILGVDTYQQAPHLDQGAKALVGTELPWQGHGV